jgi:hypothetical protein
MSVAFLAQLDGFDASSLDVLRRIFLISDGTLTDTVEAAFLEPIALIKLAADTALPRRELTRSKWRQARC